MSPSDLMITIRLRWWVKPLIRLTYRVLVHTPCSFACAVRVQNWLVTFCTRHGLVVG